MWKLEDSIFGLLEDCAAILSERPLFFAVNSYTTGLSPAVMEYMVHRLLCPRYGGSTVSDEIGLPVRATGGALPAGATTFWLEDGAAL